MFCNQSPFSVHWTVQIYGLPSPQDVQQVQLENANEAKESRSAKVPGLAIQAEASICLPPAFG